MECIGTVVDGQGEALAVECECALSDPVRNSTNDCPEIGRGTILCTWYVQATR
jgi:hypothetical protein